MKTIYEVKLKTVSLKIKDSGVALQGITNADDIVVLARTLYQKLDDDQEHFTVFFLDIQNQVKGFKILFSGGQACCSVDAKIIFRNALLFGAAGIVIVHNHPSDNADPSSEDKVLTITIKEAGKIIGINLVDHVIISNSKYVSFVGLGLL